MISNITNALPVLLKNVKQNSTENSNVSFDLVESLKFYNSIFPSSKSLVGLKHIYFDIYFKLRNQIADQAIRTFMVGIDTLDFIKDFKYILDTQNKIIAFRGSMEQFAILSLILIGSIKSLKSQIKNKSIFISMCEVFMNYCLNNGYNACKQTDIDVLQQYNEGFNQQMFQSSYIVPSSQSSIGTLHFVGIQLNYDIMKIFQKYKNVKFSYNEENASFIITMQSKDWDDFWKTAPTYLKNQFSKDENNK